jgi:hypothetical protein
MPASAYQPRPSTKALFDQGLKHCPRCGQDRPLDTFGLNNHRPGGRMQYCKVCAGQYQHDLHKRRPQVYLWTIARQRARRKGVPFGITPEDVIIPACCPACGVKLENAIGKGRKQGASPSVDRLVPSTGYVLGNIAVICSRCNEVKSDCTAEELARVARWVQEVARPVLQADACIQQLGAQTLSDVV